MLGYREAATDLAEQATPIERVEPSFCDFTTLHHCFRQGMSGQRQGGSKVARLRRTVSRGRQRLMLCGRKRSEVRNRARVAAPAE